MDERLEVKGHYHQSSSHIQQASAAALGLLDLLHIS